MCAIIYKVQLSRTNIGARLPQKQPELIYFSEFQHVYTICVSFDFLLGLILEAVNWKWI